MTAVAAVLLAVAVFVVLLGIGIAVILTSPRNRAAQERQRIDQEARFAQWRLQQVTTSAMQRLLDEARRQS